MSEAAPDPVGATRPRIGLTCSPGRSETGSADMLDHAYVTAVAEAGGTPLMIPVLTPMHVDAVLATLDGIVFTGGGDLDPSTYGQERGPDVYGVDAVRDRWELALARASCLPALGICRGAQLLNVAAGGTLVQDLPERTLWGHRETDRPGDEIHVVDIAGESRLRAVLEVEAVRANTLHHQSVDVIGKDFVVVGWADDGTTEAIESVDRPILAVQWHPEL